MKWKSKLWLIFKKYLEVDEKSKVFVNNVGSISFLDTLEGSHERFKVEVLLLFSYGQVCLLTA